MNLINRILNYGIESQWEFDKKRAYRQLNGFNAFLAIIAFSAVPIALYYNLFLGVLVQLTSALVYAGGFWAIRKFSLQKARLIAIIAYEVHIFVVSLFAVWPTGYGLIPYYSPIIVCFILYMLVAVLLDMPVFNHLAVAILQILLLQFAGKFIINNQFPTFPGHNHDFLTIIITIYTGLIAYVIIYLQYSENQKVKKYEIERSKHLEHLLTELKNQDSKIKEQAHELSKLNETRNKFFSIIAHDLKSPYNAVLGLSQLLKDKSKYDPGYNKIATSLHETAMQTYNLLENLLEWSMTQLKHVAIDSEPLNLREIVTDVFKLLSNTADAKQIQLSNEINPDIVVMADKTLTHSIFRNLLTNSVKFTNAGGLIQVDSKVKSKMVEIAVRDNGIGMTDKMAKELFKLEKKMSRKGTSNESGTGLGLFLCKELVELQKGKIWLESIENKGTTFYFSLPLAQKYILH